VRGRVQAVQDRLRQKLEETTPWQLGCQPGWLSLQEILCIILGSLSWRKCWGQAKVGGVGLFQVQVGRRHTVELIPKGVGRNRVDLRLDPFLGSATAIPSPLQEFLIFPRDNSLFPLPSLLQSRPLKLLTPLLETRGVTQVVEYLLCKY
jgi:hypothetical protein